jgi:hypothetical protein
VADYAGLLFIVREPSRLDTIERAIARADTFTDVVSAADFDLRAREVALISLDGSNLHYAALLRRGQRVATAQLRVRFTDFVSLAQLSIEDVAEGIGPSFARYLSEARRGAGQRLGPRTWEEVLSTVRSLRPDASRALDHLLRLRDALGRSFTGRGFETVAQEKDALALALDAFDYERPAVLRTWAPPHDGQPAPFLNSIGPEYLIEDQILQNDASVFGDWAPIKRYVCGAAEFGRGRQRLTVFNVNRTSVERALGVDLLYYHHEYGSYALVQYKVMKRREIKDGAKAEFRPDQSALEQLQRMRNFMHSHPDTGASMDITKYRLNPGPFVLKLCHRVVMESDSTGLLKGMYIPLDYYDLLILSGAVAGSLGGTVLTYDNVGRYWGSQLFVRLVQHGWIGSRGTVSDAVTLALQQVEADRDLTVAVSSEGEARTPFARRMTEEADEYWDDEWNE